MRHGDTPGLRAPGGWQAAHLGFERDGLVLDGLPVWDLVWRPEASPPVRLAHLAHPAQLHDFTIYAIDDGRTATRFAAAELSNGVWGFYRWVLPGDAASGVTPDGALRYVHDLGPLIGGRFDRVEPVARLEDARTGEVFFDGAAWPSSRIVPQPDGGLLLALEKGGRQTIVRIDPATRRFRDLAAPEREGPLTGLADAASLARREADRPDSVARRVAPDGSMLVELQAVEWSNTHWVQSPRVVEIATGRVLLDLWGTDWDAAVGFPGPQRLRLGLRRYRTGGGFKAEIDLAAGRYAIEGGPEGSLEGLPRALEEVSRRAAAAASARPVIAPRAMARSYGVAVLILLGAAVAIAGGTVATLYLYPEPQRPLDKIPPMPGRPG